MREAVGEGWPIIEDKLLAAVSFALTAIDRALKGLVVLPALQNRPLLRWEISASGNLGVWRGAT